MMMMIVTKDLYLDGNYSYSYHSVKKIKRPESLSLHLSGFPQFLIQLPIRVSLLVPLGNKSSENRIILENKKKWGDKE
jgi:hypothetical protein